ncbi:MAG: phospholipase D-like domain-containing protein [bacterium]|nr:phospholipase D-like domain-containing protein [bacterium]
MRVSERIERFLSDYPKGRLLVVVGYASPAGLAWLDLQTVGRPVSLLIGDTRSRYWSNLSHDDARRAVDFLSRTDVKVRNWYRTKRAKEGPSMAHMKAWVVESEGVPVAALVGSANLTKNGLEANVEIMVEATGDDLIRTWGEVRGLHEKGWDCAERLAGYMADSVHLGQREIENVGGKAESTGREAGVGRGSWQSDPTGRNQYRWREGGRWTPHVANDGVTSADPTSNLDLDTLSRQPAGRTEKTSTNRVLELPSSKRRLAAFVVEYVLIFVTLIIGWLIWSLAVYSQGKTPAKQIFRMRVIRIDDLSAAGGCRMFFREIILKYGLWLTFFITAPLFYLAPVLVGLAFLWMLIGWVVLQGDRRGQTPWDKMLGTVVVTIPRN